MGVQRLFRSAGFVAVVSLWGGSWGCSSDSGAKSDASSDKGSVSDGGVDLGANDGVQLDVGGSDLGGGDLATTDLAGTDLTVTDTASADHQIPEVGVDGSAQSPMNLTATVLVRRQTSFRLAWMAPASNGQRVAGYVVRAARVPITDANFDDFTTVTQDILYAGTPAAPGSTDGVNAQNLYIETDYYFAVAAVDAANARGPIAATTTPVRATFNATSLAGTNGATEQFGFEFDAGDADTNGISDLLVGSFNGKRAYLYLNHLNAPAVTATVTFNGDTTHHGLVWSRRSVHWRHRRRRYGGLGYQRSGNLGAHLHLQGSADVARDAVEH